MQSEIIPEHSVPYELVRTHKYKGEICTNALGLVHHGNHPETEKATKQGDWWLSWFNPSW